MMIFIIPLLSYKINPPAEDKPIVLTMTPDEFSYVMQVLSKRPIDEGMGLYMKLSTQARLQLEQQNLPPIKAPSDSAAKKVDPKKN